MNRHNFLAAALVAATALITACAASPETSEMAYTQPEVLPSQTLLFSPVVDIDGVSLDLEAGLASGQPLVLVFWQTWCGSCLAEAPALASAARVMAGKVDFLGIIPGPDSSVDEDEVRRVSSEKNLPYTHLRDRDLAWTQAFEVDGTPTLIAIGTDGQVLWRGNHPPKDWSLIFHLP